jgi:hypothetical protein
VSAADEEAPPEPLVLRRTWNRFDKLWWFGSTTFYGLPCAGCLLGSAGAEAWWVFALVGLAWIGFGWFNWHIRSVHRNALIAEVTAAGIRFSDDQQPMPWSEVAWVGRHHTPSGTWGPQSHDYVVLHRRDGSEVMQVLDIDIWPVMKAILRLAPQVPMSKDHNPPA